MARGEIAAAVCAVALVFAAPATAQTQELSILAGNSQTAAKVDMLVFAPPFANVELSELVDGVRVPLQTVAMGPALGGGSVASVGIEGFVPWRCDRRGRDFVGKVTFGDGRTIEDWSGVRTPSCDKRFKLATPTKARPGARVDVRVTDTWKLGDLKPKLCLKPPAGRYTCRSSALRAGRTKVTTKHRLGRKGIWSVQLRGPTRRLTNTIAVGVKPKHKVVRNPRVLLFGDSLMSNLVTPITDRLGRRVDVFENLYGGGGLVSPGFDWFKYAKRRIAAVKPKAAAMLIGAGDGYSITNATGAKVQCCSEEWSDLYSAKVAQMMRIMRNGGKTKVVWIVNPAMRGASRKPFVDALARAARLAAGGVPGVKLADLGEVLTPGGFYSDSIVVDGKSVRVRAVDGVHLTVAGADIAAKHVVRALKPLPR